MNEEKPDDIFEQHMKQSEKKMKVWAVLFALLMVYTAWYMLTQ